MAGLPLNPQLLSYGGHLPARARTAPGYRLLRLPGGAVPRPALVRSGDGPDAGLPLEIWDLPQQGVGALLDVVKAPLGLGRVMLHDGTEVAGFVAAADSGVPGTDVTSDGGWRAHLRRTARDA